MAIAERFEHRVPSKVVIREALIKLDQSRAFKLSHARMRIYYTALQSIELDDREPGRLLRQYTIEPYR
jgi:hypothetical protein